MREHSRNLWFILVLATALGGCASGRPLMPTPNLYSSGIETPFPNTPAALQTPEIPIFFATDRAPERDEEGKLRYGFKRSASVAFGRATVTIGEGASWDTVLAASTVRDRDPALELHLSGIEEIVRFPPTPFPFTVKDGAIEHDAETMARIRGLEAEFRGALVKQLDTTPRKEVLVFVHGFNNTFEDAAYTLAEFWHFFGREGVPILYTWPAGHGGPTGYAYDRESGEFTVFHLKQLFRALGRYEEVERVHVLAHSRGTDVAATAMRELFIEARAAGHDPRKVYKLENVVLAAPDLSLDVVQQRLQTEPVAPGIGRVTLYSSPSDEAIGFAEWLFGGLVRLGRVEAADFTPEQLEQMSKMANLDVIQVQVQGEGGAFGHGYFHANSAVSSDLLLFMRYGRLPGAEHGRPLTSLGGRFWSIDDDYLLAK